MRLKSLSSLLTVTLFLSNINIHALASSWSEDERYETFEDNNMIINDVLEEDKVDVGLEGNTIVNLVLGSDVMEHGEGIYYYNQNCDIGPGVYTIKNLSSKPIEIGVFSNTTPKEYLRSVFIEGNSSTTHVLNNNECFIDTVARFSDGWSSYDKELLKKSILIFRGDLNDANIVKHFNGIKSSGELEDNKISVISQKYNEFTNATNNLMCHFKPSISSVEGDILKDLTGNNNNATLININSSDVKSDYIQFNGIDSYATVDRIIEDDFTIMIKAQIDAANGTHDSALDVHKNQWFNHSGIFDGEAEGTKYDFGITITEDGYPAFGIGNPDKTDFYKNNCFGSVKTYVLTRSKYEGIMRFYIDGELVGEIEDTTKNPLASPAKLYIAKSSYFDFFTKMKLYELKVYDKSLEKSEIMQSNKKEVALKQPLRGITDEVRDRIVKINNRWMIERNCNEIVLDGNENWNLHGIEKEDTALFWMELDGKHTGVDSNHGRTLNILSDKFNYLDSHWENRTDDIEGAYTSFNGNMCISIKISKLATKDINGFKKWLSENPTTVVYQLGEPIYEPLNIDSTLNLYKDTTYISNSSTIPIGMKVTVDRASNKAKEFVELARNNPTKENIAQARFWTNLMKESTLKDEFQSEINTNTDVVDLSIEKKTTSANVDMYVRMKNSLSLSLDTNNIIFDDIDSTEDTELKNAVNLTISSSLPYKVNAYLEDEIYNSDKTATIDKSTLNIKMSNDNNYKAFINTTDPIVLLDNQTEGSNITYGLDFMLRGGITHKADVYKSTIKLEVEQK